LYVLYDDGEDSGHAGVGERIGDSAVLLCGEARRVEMCSWILEWLSPSDILLDLSC
jgi:hypothetical protein